MKKKQHNTSWANIMVGVWRTETTAKTPQGSSADLPGGPFAPDLCSSLGGRIPIINIYDPTYQPTN